MTLEQEQKIHDRITEIHSHIIKRLEMLESQILGFSSIGKNTIGVKSKNKIRTIEHAYEAFEHIIKMVSITTGIEVETMEKVGRTEKVVLARSYAWTLAKKYVVPGFTWDALGARFNKDHASAFYSVNKLEGKAGRSKAIRDMYSLCEKNYLESIKSEVNN